MSREGTPLDDQPGSFSRKPELAELKDEVQYITSQAALLLAAGKVIAIRYHRFILPPMMIGMRCATR
jgi:hypothetical protein